MNGVFDQFLSKLIGVHTVNSKNYGGMLRGSLGKFRLLVKSKARG